MGKHSRGRFDVRHLLDVASDRELEAWATPAPGRRVVYDKDGRELGTITGDHVIGYTVSCWDAEWWFLDLGTAEAALLADAKSRAPGRYSVAS